MPQGGPKHDFATIVPPGTEPKIHSIFDFTAEALEQLAFWLEQRGLHVPISQILGFSQFTPTVAEVAAQQSTTSTTFTDLTTAGPTISGLSDGKYFVLWGAGIRNGAANDTGQMGLFVNSDLLGDPAQAGSVTEFFTVARFADVTLDTGGNNTITTKYKSGNGSSAEFQSRELAAIRYGN